MLPVTLINASTYAQLVLETNNTVHFLPLVLCQYWRPSRLSCFCLSFQYLTGLSRRISECFSVVYRVEFYRTGPTLCEQGLATSAGRALLKLVSKVASILHVASRAYGKVCCLPKTVWQIIAFVVVGNTAGCESTVTLVKRSGCRRIEIRAWSGQFLVVF